MKSALWLAGFRPFFALACLAGAMLPVAWALMFGGQLPAARLPVPPTVWHAHEMFYGFGWAVLGGFLLTATKNWVGVRGYHGGALAFLAAAWLFERLGMAVGGAWPGWLFRLSNNLYLGAIVAMLLWTLLRHREADSYRRENILFLVVLPVFLAAKYLLLDPAFFQLGWSMTLGLYRVAFLIMLERTLTQFMKGVFQASILRDARLDWPIKLLGVVLVAADLLPAPLAAGLEFLLAALLAVRFLGWKPGLAFTRIDIGIMHLGYLCITAQLALDAAGRLWPVVWVGTVSVHLFTFGAMGLVIPAMLVRISKGHTGRKVAFDALDRAVLWIMIAGLVLRIGAPQLVPGMYLGWIHASAACWLAAFAILGWRYIPYLAQPRIDGKEH